MPKKGRKDKTEPVGTDAERYLAKLFLMMNNPNGTRRPDLISVNGRYDPRLSLEVKSGIEGKVSLISYQLHYAVTTEEDYVGLFGEDLPKMEGTLPGLDSRKVRDIFPERSNVAYYYALVGREKGLTSGDFEKPFSTIQLEWGDVAIIPHEMAFYSFAIARHIRTQEGLNEIIEGLWEQIREDVVDQSSHYLTRKEKQDWQNLYLRDARAIFENNMELATKDGREHRIPLLKEVYPGFESLKSVEIPGVNGTRIMVLSNPEDYDLFNRQLRSTVDQRREAIEVVARARKRACSLLDKIGTADGSFFDLDSDGTLSEGLKDTQRRKLKRLSYWAPYREALELEPEYNPAMDGCSDEIEDGIPIVDDGKGWGSNGSDNDPPPF